jgi:ATP-GRASP peptide maturase of grasp-with-spasm system
MILILSESHDISTFQVTEWLIHYKAKFIRINADTDIISNIHIITTPTGIDTTLYLDGRTFSLSELTAYWYRRSGLPRIQHGVKAATVITETFTDTMVSNQVKTHLGNELKTIKRYIYDRLDQVPIKIGSDRTASVNKVTVNHHALDVGLLIPDAIISTQPLALHAFASQQAITITKSIGDGLHAKGTTHGWSSYTEVVNTNALAALPYESIFPSLLQKGIQKKYELRIFYLLGQFYSMAIFSQQNEQTSVDFRKYDKQKPNRNVPYLLPNGIQEKLTALMNKLKLETGSIEQIKMNY